MSGRPRGLTALGSRPARPVTRATGIELLSGLALPDDEIRYLESLSALPGERVVAARPGPMRDVDPAREAERLSAFRQGETLVVGRTTASGSPEAILVEYEFEGRAGRWPAAAFDDEVEPTHFYGVVLNRAGLTWAVEIDDATGKAIGDAKEISRTLSRRGLLRMVPLGETLDGAFASYDVPQSGEYMLLAAEHGTFRLEACIWSSGVGERDLAAAEGAVDELVEAVRGAFSKPS